jgi:hypothetical protein
VSLFLVDWEDPGGERVALASGELGDVAVKANGFEAELRGPPPCSSGRWSSRPRPNAGPSWATGGAGSTWRRGCG